MYSDFSPWKKYHCHKIFGRDELEQFFILDHGIRVKDNNCKKNICLQQELGGLSSRASDDAGPTLGYKMRVPR